MRLFLVFSLLWIPRFSFAMDKDLCLKLSKLFLDVHREQSYRVRFFLSHAQDRLDKRYEQFCERSRQENDIDQIYRGIVQIHNEEAWVWRKKGLMAGGLLLGIYANASFGAWLSSLSTGPARYASFVFGTLSGIFISGVFRPITGRLSSMVTQSSFETTSDDTIKDQAELDAIWHETYAHYGENAQMARNVVSQCILNLKQNFLAAHMAISRKDYLFAASQVVDAALRASSLYSDVSAENEDVKRMAQSTFFGHLDPVLRNEFKDLCGKILEREYQDSRFQKEALERLALWFD